jgi:hypothetical protein
MRNGRVKVDGEDERVEVVCREPFECVARHARRIIK